MNRFHRDRVTIDLRGLRPAVEALARERQMTIAALGRTALLRMVDETPHATLEAVPPPVVPDKKKQFTIRMHCADIERVVTEARALGASYGTYIAALLDGAPPPLIIDPQRAIAALATSNDRLTSIAFDLNELVCSIRGGALPSARECSKPVDELLRLILPHLESASRLMAELLPARPRRRRRRRRTAQVPS